MKEEQIKQLKDMMSFWKGSQGELKELSKSELLAYLDGALSGIELPQ